MDQTFGQGLRGQSARLRSTREELVDGLSGHREKCAHAVGHGPGPGTGPTFALSLFPLCLSVSSSFCLSSFLTFLCLILFLFACLLK